jgi:thiol-disulfide isomerase/thioredoxin
MKVITILVCTILGSFSSNAQSKLNANIFSLNGKISGQASGTIYLTGFFGPGKKWNRDSSLIKNGTFNFKGTISEPTEAYISLSQDGSYDLSGNTASIFLEPSKMSVSLQKNQFNNMMVTGSKSQMELAELNKLKATLNRGIMPLSQEYQKLNLEYIAAMRRTKNEDSLQYYKDRAVAAKDAMDPYIEKLDEIDKTFIEKHPASYVTASMMRYKISSMTASEVESIYKKMPPAIQESSYGENIIAELNKLKEGSPGAEAYNFAATDINDKVINLSDFKGKYVMLDFWASWCVPCRKGNPHMKELYSQYKNKGFEIIGISDDDSKPDAWKKAVEKDGIGIWRHILRGLRRTKDGYDKSADISEHYGIHTLPTKILIDPKGVIIGRYGGGGEDDEAMDKKLKEVFG